MELKQIWYVDDDSEMIQAVKLMLKLLGYETRPFLDARKAGTALVVLGLSPHDLDKPANPADVALHRLHVFETRVEPAAVGAKSRLRGSHGR